MSISTQYYGVAVHDGRIGILDIGSNSVRLVIYDGMKRAPMPVFNEKSLCELGKNVARTGRLNPEGVVMARECIGRFLAMARVMDVVELYILATAAIRDAEDGRAFVREIEQTHGVSVRIISGKEEARLAARGVQASMHEPIGLVGDLGGGSFELVRLNGERLHQQETLPLGALRLKVDSDDDPGKAAAIARGHYAALPWLKNYPMETFYAVGGSFRSIARAYLLESGYPLEVLHAYEVEAADLLPWLRRFIATPPDEIGDLQGASRKRAHSLPFAAVALAELLEHVPIRRVIFSTAGIREGYLFDQLSPYLKQEDGMIACCVDLATQSGRLESYARDLFNWMSPLFEGETEAERRIRFACCVLSEFAWRIHPQYRSEWMFMRIIQSSIIGMSHVERVMLANALYYRHTLKTELKTKVLKLLEPHQKLWGQCVGASLSVGFMLSGGMSGVLAKTPLVEQGGRVQADIAPELQNLLTETVQKRLDGLGEMLSDWRRLSR